MLSGDPKDSAHELGGTGRLHNCFLDNFGVAHQFRHVVSCCIYFFKYNVINIYVYIYIYTYIHVYMVATCEEKNG